jgi:ubiquinone/menaquinone biosynthesis C-methylase UbiE
VFDIKREFETARRLTIAEFGAGTGLFTEIIVRSFSHLNKLYIADPDEDGRRQHQSKFQKNFPYIDYVQAGAGGGEVRAENSGLPDGKLDGIFIGHAFHWMKPEETRKEFLRILKPGAKVFIMTRDTVLDDAVSKAFFDFTRFGRRLENRKANWEAYESETMRKFYGYKIKATTVCTEHRHLTRDQLQAEIDIRVNYGGSGDWEYEELLKKTDAFFDKYQEDGVLTLKQRTFYYCGTMDAG